MMKFLVTLTFSLSCFICISQTSTRDTLIKGVRVGFSYSNNIFPDSWQVAPINAQGEQVSLSEIRRCKAVMVSALDKYPLPVLQKDLAVVYFLKTMKFYEVGYGGTNSTDALYLTNNGASQGYTDLYLEQTFHHEYSSILYRKYPTFFNEAGWMSANIPGFNYNDPENGVGAIRNNRSSQDLDTALCRKGFLTQYSLSGLENDINTFAQNIFSPSPGFWQIAADYPRIDKKVKWLIAFYNKLDPVFTEDYFKKLSR